MSEDIAGMLHLHMQANVTVESMAGWSRERIEHFFRGLSMTMASIHGEPTAEGRLMALWPEYDPEWPQEQRNLWWKQFTELVDKARGG